MRNFALKVLSPHNTYMQSNVQDATPSYVHLSLLRFSLMNCSHLCRRIIRCVLSNDFSHISEASKKCHLSIKLTPIFFYWRCNYNEHIHTTRERRKGYEWAIWLFQYIELLCLGLELCGKRDNSQREIHILCISLSRCICNCLPFAMIRISRNSFSPKRIRSIIPTMRAIFVIKAKVLSNRILFWNLFIGRFAIDYSDTSRESIHRLWILVRNINFREMCCTRHRSNGRNRNWNDGRLMSSHAFFGVFHWKAFELRKKRLSLCLANYNAVW